MKPMMRARMIGKKVLRKPITFKEKRKALGIARYGDYADTHPNGLVHKQIRTFDMDNKPKVGEISLHPKIEKNNNRKDNITRIMDDKISNAKAIKPKSEKEKVLKDALIKKLEVEKKKRLEDIDDKNRTILSIRSGNLQKRLNKIIPEKLDLLASTKYKIKTTETFGQLIKQIEKRNAYSPEAIRETLGEVYHEYLKKNKTEYSKLTVTDYNSIKLKFKTEFGLAK